uniref:Uncharacterized protein n=1 Tax=Anopheles minimus TaxID=112268 RepID=A0A182W2A6_9DIPT
MFKYCVLIATIVTLTEAYNFGEAGIDVKVNVEKNSNSYLSGRLPDGPIEYGLDVKKQQDNHFQHKVLGPDDVTYGCYGFVDPDGKPHLVHYVSDLKGYRVIPPYVATKIYVARLEDSINNVYQASQEKNVQWKDLFFPPGCKRQDTDITDTSSTTTRSPPTPSPPTPSPPTPSPPTPSPPTPPVTKIVTSTTTTTTTTTRRPPVTKLPKTTSTTSAPTTTTTTTTRRPPSPKLPKTTTTTSAPTTTTTTTPAPGTKIIDPNNCTSIVQPPPAGGACSAVCDELKNELKDIKEQLKKLVEMQTEKPKGDIDGSGSKFAYFQVILSDKLPDGVDASSTKFVFPTVPQQCGKQ